MVQRLLTAAVGLPVLLTLVWLGEAWFMALVVVAAFIAAWELGRIALGWGQAPIALVAPCVAAAIIPATYLSAESDSARAVSAIAALMALAAAGFMIFGHRVRGSFVRPLVTLAVVLFIGGTLLHGPFLRDISEGRDWVIFLLGVTFATDTAAFLVGRTFGSRKLAPSISPGKTWEGAIGGFFGAVAAGVGIFVMLDLPIGTVSLLLLSAVLGVVGQAGDLFESKLKRLGGFDDSGVIFPGHGGVLDRLDSIVWNLVVVYHWVS